MVNSSLKRIIVDIVDIVKDPLENVHLSYNEENIYEIHLLIIGNEGTPYEKGFYMFKINFTERYPEQPPKVKFLTTIEKIRVNPNLYDNGKVCLSILGTWSGPEWTQAMTLRSLILSLQSLLSENPLRNEPGYENEDSNSLRNTSYNSVVRFFNWSYAVIKMIESPAYFNFKPIIETVYKENYNKYMTLLEERKKEEISVVKCMYGMKMLVDYKSLILPSIEIACPKNSC